MRLATISIDVESDWGGRLTPSPQTLKGVQLGLPEIMTILKNSSIKATLFVSGQTVPFIAKQLEEAADNEHEIASHSFTHRRLPELSIKELDEEIAKSKAILEDATSDPVIGFRAPQARIPKELRSRLIHHGYTYDSSVFRGFFPTRFNNLDVPSLPYLQENIWEIPVTKLPLMPFPMGLLWIERIGLPLVKLGGNMSGWPPFIHIYLHPFDVIEAYPVDNMPVAAKWWYARKPGSALQTLRQLINLLQQLDYAFIPARDMVGKNISENL